MDSISGNLGYISERTQEWIEMAEAERDEYEKKIYPPDGEEIGERYGIQSEEEW